MPRNYNTQGVQNAYQGSRIGENIGLGKLPAHYEMMTDFAWANSNIGAIADVQRGVVGEKYMYTQVLPPQIFRQNLIDGVGTWSYSVVKDNSFTLNRMGFRYMNEIIPYGTWEWVSSNLGYQAEYFAKAAEALMEDEYDVAFDVLTSRLATSTLVAADYPNLKSRILAEVNALEAKTGIPRNYMTLSLSRDALDQMTGEEIFAQNLYAGALQDATRVAQGNVWSVGNIVEMPRGGHDRDVLYMIHIKDLLKVVVFAPAIAPGFFTLSERQGSPLNKRFVASDGLTVDYFDDQAGVIATKSQTYEGMPEIMFISSNKTLEIPTGATIDLDYLVENYGLEGREHELNGQLGDDITDSIVVTSSFDAETIGVEGIGYITLELTSPKYGLTTTDRVAVFLKEGAVPPTEQVAARAELRAMAAKVEAVEAAEAKTAKKKASK